MAASLIVPGLWQISLGFVNAYLFDTGDGLALIDTGVPGSAAKILKGVAAIGKKPTDVRHLIVTHCHFDHSGSLAELKRLTHAPATMHPEDAALIQQGVCKRNFALGPGVMNKVIGTIIKTVAASKVESTSIEHQAADGAELPGGLIAVHAPGHCAGQLALYSPKNGGILIAADAAANVLGLNYAPVYEDVELGKKSLAKLSTFNFEVAVFGHGQPIKAAADKKFRALAGA